MVEAVGHGHEHRGGEAPAEAARVEKVGRPYKQLFRGPVRVEEVRIDVKEQLEFVPLLIRGLLIIAQVVLDKGQIALRNHVFRPVHSWSSDVDHLEVGIIERLGALQPLVYQERDHHVVVSIIVRHKESLMALEKMADR